MKITKRQLRRIIKEEKAKMLKEVHGGGWNGSYGGSTRSGFEALATIADELAAAKVVLSPEAWKRIAMGINFVEKEARSQ
mgnify:CR=1 FL=1